MRNTWSFRSLLIWISIALFAYGLVLTGNSRKAEYLDVKFSDFVKDVETDKVKDVKMSHGSAEVIANYRTNAKALVRFPEYDRDFVVRLLENKVEVYVTPHDELGYIFWINLLTSFLPSFVLFMLVLYSNTSRGGVGPFNLGKSKAKKLGEKDKIITFDDVAGLPEAKDELIEIVNFLKHPEKFASLGARIPKGVLLYGPPGTGKTLLARAIAGEAKVPFLYMSGSDFVEVFVGVGASRVRDVFAQAKKFGKCIIFIDELDSIGKKRNTMSMNDERENTLNQFLVELDGFDGDTGVIVIGATNRPEVLDPALLRPGRFDRLIPVPLPDAKGREEILRTHLRKVKVAEDGVNLKNIVYGTVGMAGAELADLVNRAAIITARASRTHITTDDLRAAMEEIILGSKSSVVMDEEERLLTAYHEAGHAIVSLHTKYSNPIFKATIIPTGKALGMVVSLPEKDEISVTKAKLLDQICMGMGGRCAEEIKFGPELVTSGASSDIRFVTNVATKMVTQWGMSEELGYVHYSTAEDIMNYGAARASEETLKKVDEEVRKIIDSQYERARDILTTHAVEHERLSQALLVHETLTGEQVKHVVQYGTLDDYDAEAQEVEDRYIYKPSSPFRPQEESSTEEEKE